MNIYMHLIRFFVNVTNLCCGNDLTKREKRDIIKVMFAMANRKGSIYVRNGEQET